MTFKQRFLLGKDLNDFTNDFITALTIVFLLFSTTVVSFWLLFEFKLIQIAETDRLYLTLDIILPAVTLILILALFEVLYFFRNWLDDFENPKVLGFYPWFYRKMGFVKEQSVLSDFAWTYKKEPSRLWVVMILSQLFVFFHAGVYIIVFTTYGKVLTLLCIPFYLRHRIRVKKKLKKKTASDYIHDQP